MDDEDATILDEDESTAAEETDEASASEEEDTDNDDEEDVWKRLVDAAGQNNEDSHKFSEDEYLHAVEDEFVRTVTIADDISKDETAGKSLLSYAKKLKRQDRTMDYEEALYIALKHRRRLIRKLIKSYVKSNKKREEESEEESESEQEQQEPLVQGGGNDPLIKTT